jgi:vacuolar-type H+-ATPase subunit I/STV1
VIQIIEEFSSGPDAQVAEMEHYVDTLEREKKKLRAENEELKTKMRSRYRDETDGHVDDNQIDGNGH